MEMIQTVEKHLGLIRKQGGDWKQSSSAQTTIQGKCQLPNILPLPTLPEELFSVDSILLPLTA